MAIDPPYFGDDGPRPSKTARRQAEGQQRRRSPRRATSQRLLLQGKPSTARTRISRNSLQTLPQRSLRAQDKTKQIPAQQGRRQASPSPKTRVRNVWSTYRASARQIRVRLLLVWVVLVLAALILTGNLFRLQVLQGADLQARAKLQQLVSLKPFAPRRPIVDATGNILAIDRPVYTLYAHPKLFKLASQDIATRLSSVINRPSADLLKRFGEGESGLEIATALPEDLAHRVTLLQLDGLELVQSPQRFYPQENLLAEVVGYVNLDLEGQSGVEYSQQDVLRKQMPDEVEILRSGDGSVMPSDLPDEMLGQDDLKLTLSVDSRLQRMARIALKEKMQEFSAKRGTVIVMDVQDGALKALVTEPTYDPNLYYKSKPESLKNWALSDLYEPGSTFKPVNVAIALEQGAIQPNDTFEDPGQIFIGEWTIQNSDYESAGGRGTQSVTEIVQNSSNVGMVRIIQRMKPGRYYKQLEKLGLGKVSGIDLPFEAESYLKPKKDFLADPVEAATTAFGQGFSLTPIKLAQLHTAIANGGRLVTPHVVEGLYDSYNKLKWRPEHLPQQRVFSPKTTQEVLGMMEKVVSDGTGKAAQIPGYLIAGKTGTAQKANPDGGGYLPGARITSFVSIFPADKPRYTVLVVVDEPQGDNAFGSSVAAPVAKNVMEALISIGQISPTEPVEPEEY